MAPRKRSLAWSYFKLIDKRTVQCLLCTVCVVHNSPSTTNLMRHLRSKHPDVIANADDGHGAITTDNDDQQNSGDFCSAVEVEMDDESGPITTVTVDDAAITNAINGILEAAQQVSVRKEASKDSDDGSASRKRSSVWKHYKQMEDPTSSLCLLCMEEIKHYKGTSNLKRHLSKKHPGAFADLGRTINEQSPNTVQQKHVTKKLAKSPKSVVKEKRTDVSYVSRECREEDISELERVRELIEALRNAQRQEARALEHQRELVEMLRDGNARELTLERERIESLRKAQENESTALDRQREELQKEKEELQIKWEELQKEKEELQIKWGELEQNKERCTCQLEDQQ